MSYRNDGKSYYKKEYYSKNPNNWSNNKSQTDRYHYSKYEQNQRKSYQTKDSYSNHTKSHHSDYKEYKQSFENSKYTTNSRKSAKEPSNSSRKKQSWSIEKDGEKRTERSFLDYIGVETDDKVIAKRQHQIDAAKASLAYARYSMLVAKNQRITDMPQTPNKFMKTDTDSWMETIKKWVKQLRGWQFPGAMSLPSPVWVPDEKREQVSSPTPPLLDYESESSVESRKKYRPKRDIYYEKKIERKRRRSFTPSPTRDRSYADNSHYKYPRTSSDNSKYGPRGYTKKIHYEAFSNSEDFITNSPKVERKVSYVKDYGPRFTHSTREDNYNSKEDLRYKMKYNNSSQNYRSYRNDHERRSYTNISWSPDNSPVRQGHSNTHYSPFGRPRSTDGIPRDRMTSPITPPSLRKEMTPEFDIPGQQWEMENELVLLDDV
ncbi:Histone RNA hairpin-binding protein-like [Oopsacas minuta]|uniref:Histone RNA hairpin-binding protein-like n=1 Tax=Oopsacas minuta TaxID=111878 RepID=A0AAV7K124_9METZ|nr:Histone RNA hairpin-binding protein-like [Oopsacas minuta]